MLKYPPNLKYFLSFRDVSLFIIPGSALKLKPSSLCKKAFNKSLPFPKINPNFKKTFTILEKDLHHQTHSLIPHDLPIKSLLHRNIKICAYN